MFLETRIFRKGRITYFRGHYLIVWFIVPLVSASIWITQLWVFQHPNSVTSAYLRWFFSRQWLCENLKIRDRLTSKMWSWSWTFSETVFVNYGMNISDITYTGSLFYPPDEHGVPHLDLMQLFSYLGFCVTMVFFK